MWRVSCRAPPEFVWLTPEVRFLKLGKFLESAKGEVKLNRHLSWSLEDKKLFVSDLRVKARIF